MVGDARLKTIARNLAEEAAINALEACKAERLRKKREKAEGIASQKAECAAKKAEKEAQKAARVAELAALVAAKPPKKART